MAPANAYVAFQDNQFVIVPETEGSKLEIKKAYQTLKDAVADSVNEVDFSAQPVYQKAEVTQDDPNLAKTLEECNNYTKASITYTSEIRQRRWMLTPLKIGYNLMRMGRSSMTRQLFVKRLQSMSQGLHSAMTRWELTERLRPHLAEP